MLWSLLRELFDQRLKLAVGSCVCHSRLQPDHGHDGSRSIIRELPRQVNVAVAPRETLRRDSDDGIALVRKLNRLANDAGVGIVMPLPELISEHRHRLRVLPFRGVCGKNSAPKQCGDTEVSESISRKVDRGNVFGKVTSRCGQIPFIHRGYALGRSGLTKLLKLRSGEGNPARIAAGIPDA